MIQGLLEALQQYASLEDAASLSLRSFAYQAVGQLSKRLPTVLQVRIDIARRFFKALSEESAEVRPAVQDAVNSMAIAYQESSDNPITNKEELEQMLLENVESSSYLARLCAVRWASLLFKFDSYFRHFICVKAVGDQRLQVQEEALRGLKLRRSHQVIIKFCFFYGQFKILLHSG